MGGRIITQVMWSWDVTRSRLELSIHDYNARLDKIFDDEYTVFVCILFKTSADHTAFVLKYGNEITVDKVNEIYFEKFIKWPGCGCEHG